ncbi:hypothetical protein AC579_6014 [Pseudocercospora musae]|uniref:Uncharacterized protein n=1 Tax=Pseudocercospora musae TaxID=113226 RepID=A0A139HRX6_9PEZI|nr:hypothetical protein AC579_6014 [Pseudocercospora musae]
MADAVPTTRLLPCRSMKHLICPGCDTFWKPELCSLFIKSPIGPQSIGSETPGGSIIERQMRPQLLLRSTTFRKFNFHSRIDGNVGISIAKRTCTTPQPVLAG